MKVAIMQPYFFPYIGYFQLMEAVDLFVFYENVQYMKGGWVNRNRILNHGKVEWLTLPVSHASYTDWIMQRTYILGEPVAAIKRKLESAYSESFSYGEICPIIDDILDFGNPNVACFNVNLLTALSRELGIDCEFELSSNVKEANGFSGVDKVLRLCKHFSADQYVNPIGGMSLYQPEDFTKNGVRLSFIKTTCEPEVIGGKGEYLSIIHELMAYGPGETRERLKSYEILKPEKI